MLSTLITILLFILIIGFLTFVHELGHFLVAKAIKAKVYEFSLGFGPKLVSKKYKGTDYSVRIVPFGGFVKVMGDGDPGQEVDEKKYKESKYNLNNKPKGLQILVMLAGVSMNILFAILFYYIILGKSEWRTNPIFLDMGKIDVIGASTEKVIGYQLIEEGNAQKSGMPEFGMIREINGVNATDKKSLVETIGGYERVTLLICNEIGDECNEYEVDVDDEKKIGVYIFSGYILDYSEAKLFAGPLYLINNLKLIFSFLGSMIGTAKETGDYSELSNVVSGPVGIFLVIDNFKSRGAVVLLSLIADLSLSLAIVNLLPIPALDGGRVLILLIESILRRDLNEKVKASIINISFGLLMLLIVLVVIKDIVNIDSMKEFLK